MGLPVGCMEAACEKESLGSYKRKVFIRLVYLLLLTRRSSWEIALRSPSRNAGLGIGEGRRSDRFQRGCLFCMNVMLIRTLSKLSGQQHNLKCSRDLLLIVLKSFSEV